MKIIYNLRPCTIKTWCYNEVCYKGMHCILQTPRKSFFESNPREARKQQFQKFCDEFIRRMSTMPPEAKRPCIEKSTNLFGTPSKYGKCSYIWNTFLFFYK